MKYLVSGGAGFIGSHLVEFLVQRGDSVVVFDNLNTGKEENLGKNFEKIDFVRGDIRNFDLLSENFKNIDGVFHQAALASVQESFLKPEEYHDVNVKGAENIFKLSQKNDVKVVYASSSSVYGNPKLLPIKEEHQKNPINPYAQTKLDKEFLAERYVKSGSRIIGLRYFNVFGERQSKEYAGVIKKFLTNIRNKEPPKINGDGSQTRDFVYVGDVVKANVMLMESNVDHAFLNIGTGNSVSVKELANLIISISGFSLKPIHGPALEGDVKSTQADIFLIKKLVGWEPKISLKNWLEEIIPKLDQVVI